MTKFGVTFGAILSAFALALPASAAATVLSGEGQDPAGDQTAGGANADVTAFRVSYDDAGTISGQLTLAAPLPASSSTFAFLFFGVRAADGTCTTAVGLGDTIGLSGSNPTWGTPADPDGGGPAQRTQPDAATIALSATSAALAGRAFDCAFAATSGGGGDRTEPVTLQAPPQPDPPTPQPPTDPPPAQPKPPAPRTTKPRTTKPKPRASKPKPKPKPARRRPRVARLRLSLTAPRALAPGRSLTLRLVVANSGRATARRVRLSAQGRGLAIAPAARVLGTLRPGARRVVSLRLKRRGRGAATVRLRLTGAGRLSAARTLTIPLPATPRRPARPRPTPPASDGLAGQAFLRLVSGSPGVSQDRREGYIFTGPRWVYRGTPEDGMPSCSARTAGADEDDEGCVPYSYDARSGALEIDGRPARLAGGGTELTVGETTFLLKQSFAPGQRLSVSLKNIEVYGMWPNQSVFTSWLTLAADGQFAFSSSAIGSLGNGDPSTISSTISPDQRGTYEIVAGSTIVFHYADGRTGRRLILVNGTPTATSRPDPQADGLLLDGTSWWS